MSMRALATLLASTTLIWCAGAQAAPRVVRGDGRAAIAGQDVAGARKAALADALYDAAGKLQTKVRGVSHLDTGGRLTTQSTSLVDGRFQGYHVVREGREGSSYVVSLEAIGEGEPEACEGKRADIDMRAINLRVAPGVTGDINTAVREGVARGVEEIGQSPSLRVADQRFLPALRGSERNRASQNDYMAQMTGALPSPTGYSLSGSVIVERVRNDILLANITSISIKLSLKLRDNYTGAHLGDVIHGMEVRDRMRPFGLDEALTSPTQVDVAPLFAKVREDLEGRIACKPLRAMVLEASGGKLLLSVGIEHGVNPGDYFLVTLPNAKADWQILQVEDSSPERALAKPLKPRPAIPLNAVAVLMR